MEELEKGRAERKWAKGEWFQKGRAWKLEPKR